MLLEKEQLKMMKEMGLSHSDEISNTLIKAGNMLMDKVYRFWHIILHWWNFDGSIYYLGSFLYSY